MLLGPAVHALAATGSALSLQPADLRFTMTGYGYLERVAAMPDAAGVAPGPAAFGHQLDDALARIIEPLAEVGEVPVQRLWALAADSLGNRLIAERRTDLAAAIAAASSLVKPAPRFLEIGPGPNPATYLRRASCCMVFRVPGQDLCISCPRQPPAARQARLEAHATSVAASW